MKKISLSLVFLSLLFSGFQAQAKEIKSVDGSVSINTPDSWSPQPDLNKEADLQVADPSSELYLIILSEKKTDFEAGMTLQKHSDTTRNAFLQNTGIASTAQVTGPTPLVINGKQAIQYTITANVTVKNEKNEDVTYSVVYWHTTVETETRFHQILAWTLSNYVATKSGELQQVIKSFQEVGSATPTGGTTGSPVTPTDTQPTNQTPPPASGW